MEGCGDFLNDYEGISGYEYYRDDLGLMYFAGETIANWAGVTSITREMKEKYPLLKVK